MNKIILRMNSTFATIGKATTDKLTEKLTAKTSFRFSMKNIWTTCSHAGKNVCQIWSFSVAFRKVFSLHREWNFVFIELLAMFLSLGVPYLWILEIKCEQCFHLDTGFAYLIYGDFHGLFVLLSLFASFKYFSWILFSYYRTAEKRTKWALI